MRTRSIIISGGGTGGHLYPALVVGHKIVELEPGLELTFVGTTRPLEAQILRAQGVRFVPMRIEGLKGRGMKSLRALLLLPGAFGHALALLVRLRPALVIGAGGYSSGPIVLLAAWLGIPTMILEQNARPGLTNRLLARWVKAAVTAFPSTLPAFKGKGQALGNPVREDFYPLPAKPHGSELHVLVFGGSQGSRFLNDRVTAALPLLVPSKGRLRLTHQTGPADLERVRAAYRAHGFDRADVAVYIPAMAQAFAAADLIVCRAGATTIAELIAARKAALLVPFAQASEDHQTANARELASVGAADLMPEASCTPEALAARILHYLDRPGDLETMERRLARLQAPDPAGRIAALALNLMGRAPKEKPA